MKDFNKVIHVGFFGEIPHEIFWEHLNFDTVLTFFKNYFEKSENDNSVEIFEKKDDNFVTCKTIQVTIEKQVSFKNKERVQIFWNWYNSEKCEQYVTFTHSTQEFMFEEDWVSAKIDFRVLLGMILGNRVNALELLKYCEGETKATIS